MTSQSIPLKKNKKYHVYICSSNHSSDLAFSEKIKNVLNEKGLIIYSAENDFSPHLSIAKNLEQAMRLSWKLIYIVSSHCLPSKIWELESEIAFKMHLNDMHSNTRSSTLIPIVIGQCDMPDYMMHLRFIDANKPESDWIPVLLNAIQEEVVHQPAPTLPEGKDYHVFFIYRTVSPDKDWVRQVAETLEGHESGFECAYHERDFVVGKTIFQNITYFLKRSSKVVIVLTPDFLQSIWTKYETEIAQILSIRDGGLRIVPVVLQHCTIPDSLATLTYLDATEQFLLWWPRLLKTINMPNEDLQLQPQRCESTVQTLRLGQYFGKQQSDEFKSWLIDAQFVQNKFILVSDAKNKKMKKFEFNGGMVVEKSFDSRPMFFTCFEDDMVYISFPDEPLVREIQASDLEITNQFEVSKHCAGISNIGQDKLAVANRLEGMILILSRDGVELDRIQPRIGVNELTCDGLSLPWVDEGNDSEEEIYHRNKDAGHKDFNALQQHRKTVKEAKVAKRMVWPGHIAASTDFICVSDYETSLLTIINMTTNPYTHQSLPLVDVRGITLHEGNIFVAAGNIRRLSLDLKDCEDVPLHGSKINFPRAISFDKSGLHFVVTHKGDHDDGFTIFQIIAI